MSWEGKRRRKVCGRAEDGYRVSSEVMGREEGMCKVMVIL